LEQIATGERLADLSVILSDTRLADVYEECTPVYPSNDKFLNSLVRVNSHQVVIDMPFVRLVVTNADGFFNLERVELRDTLANAELLSHVEGLLGQSYHVHHMKNNGQKEDGEAAEHVGARTLARYQHLNKIAHHMEKMQKLLHDRADQAVKEKVLQLGSYYNAEKRQNDENFHINDYFVVSQDLFGVDFVENRYDCRV